MRNTEIRDLNDGEHVPSLHAVPIRNLSEKMVPFTPEINEGKKVICKLWGKGVSAPASLVLDVFRGPEWNC